MRTLVRLICLVSLLATSARAEVTAQSSTGFISEHEMVLSGTPARVYQALTAEIGNWWDATHSYSGVAANFSLQASAGGCLCERLDDDGSVEHMRVIFAQPGKLLRLSGGLGPLQGMGASGSMDFELEATDATHTRLVYRYIVSGYAPAGLDLMARPVDRVQLGQLERLAAYLALPQGN
jgi:uncharacterized protein YndB with AHSA1/START domain